MTDKEKKLTPLSSELDPRFEYQDDPDYGKALFKVLIGLIVVTILACIAGTAIALYGSWQLQLCSVIAILLFTSYLYVRWKLRN